MYVCVRECVCASVTSVASVCYMRVCVFIYTYSTHTRAIESVYALVYTCKKKGREKSDGKKIRI